MNIDIYNLLDDLISVTDNDGVIINCNDSFCTFFQVEKSSIIGLNEHSFLLSKNYHLIEKNKNYYHEKTIINSNIYYFKLKKKEKYNNEQLEYIVNIRKDITREKKLTNLYEENKKILKQIADDEKLYDILNSIINSAEKINSNMMCSILLLDESGEQLYSAAAPSIPEFFTSKINGMKIGKKVGSCGAAAYLKERVIVEDTQNHENWVLAKNLAKKANLYACWSQPIISSKGEVLGTFAMYYSTTKKPTALDLYIIEDRASLAGIAIEKYNNELKIQENLLKQKKQQELLMHKTKQAMMGEMLENIAHQWRQPLSIISTSATGISLKKELGISSDEMEINALKAINNNAQHLSRTIDDFRNYFKSENDEHKFNLSNTIHSTIKLIEVLLNNKFVEVIYNIDENIELYTLENELIQILMNIFNNAIDELEKEECKERYINIEVFKDKNSAVIKINDSAGGAKDEVINRVFEPYFTTKHKSHGTGIGLYMCKEMIEKHMNGTITAKNSEFNVKENVYKGLEFTITLPIK